MAFTVQQAWDLFREHELQARAVDALNPNEWPFAVQAIRADFQYLDAHHQLAIAIGVQLVNKAHERMTASYGAVLQHPGQLEITKNQPEIVILEDYLRLLSLLQSYRTDFVSAAGRLGAAKLSAGFALGHDSLNYIWNLQNQVSGCLAQDQARVHRAQAQLTKAKTKAELRDTFLTSHFSIPGAWRGVKLFDEGANTAGLFVLHDEHDTIIERVVKKSEVCDNASWPKRFDNFPHNPRFREGWLTEKCADAASSHFVGYRGHDYDVPKRIVSLYTNYCPFGDLWGILSVDRMRFQVPVPEPFLWAAFIQLVEACKVMRDGMLEEGHVVGWKHIIHRDIKPDNIFLDLPSENRFKRYPTLKLGDFGLAIETTLDDPANPSGYNGGAGTYPFRAPEQWSGLHPSHTRKLPQDPQLWEWTNIYSIGLIIYNLMVLRFLRREEEKFFTTPQTRWPWTRPGTNGYPPHLQRYTAELKVMVHRCINPDPEARPTLDELYEQLTQLNPRTGTPQMIAYMQNAIRGDVTRNDGFELDFLYGGGKSWGMEMARLGGEGEGDEDGEEESGN